MLTQKGPPENRVPEWVIFGNVALDVRLSSGSATTARSRFLIPSERCSAPRFQIGRGENFLTRPPPLEPLWGA
jgi:hypothetical protein